MTHHDKPDADAVTSAATEDTAPSTSKEPSRRPKLRTFLLAAGIAIGTATIVAGGIVGYLYASTPISIREPLPEHYHFRMQVLVNGQAENFGSAPYQEGYAKDNCSAALTDSPIHFHDNQDQFTHIHWEGMTGGQVLKYYGWNFIGGTRGSLGYRFDDNHRLQKVAIHGNNLPAIPSDAQFYVYTSKPDGGYDEKRFDDFTKQDLEVFFNKTSNYPAHKLNQEKRKSSLLDYLSPKAMAHNGEDHGSMADADVAELTRINNLLGDVVIFVQKDKPSDAQIKDRFSKLTPLTESSCGG